MALLPSARSLMPRTMNYWQRVVQMSGLCHAGRFHFDGERVSLFHPVISRVCRTWMALASCPARQGQQRSLRRIRQVLSWALARSPGARSWA